MKRVIVANNFLVEGFPEEPEINKDWNSNPELSQEEANVLNEFQYWILTKSKKFEIESLNDFINWIYNNTLHNKRSSNYQNESTSYKLSILTDIANRCDSLNELRAWTRQARREYDKARDDYEKADIEYAKEFWPQIFQKEDELGIEPHYSESFGDSRTRTIFRSPNRRWK